MILLSIFLEIQFVFAQNIVISSTLLCLLLRKLQNGDKAIVGFFGKKGSSKLKDWSKDSKPGRPMPSEAAYTKSE